MTNGRVGILFGDRTGGVSAPPFDTANAGFWRGDDPDAVAENRRRLGFALGGPAADPATWTCLHQVHGVGVASSGAVRDVLPEADAAVTADPEATLAILTADCGPVALVAPGATAAVHAGWRGVAAGVLEATVARLAELTPATPQAFIGPCVRPCCYEFKPAELELIVARLGPSVIGKTSAGAVALDVPAAIRAALARTGVTDVSDSGVCTSCSRDHFSHRRDGRTGLQLMLVSGPRS